VNPTFLSVEDVIDIHAEQIKAFGGADGVRDHGALASAVAQPQAGFGGEFFHHDLFEMAAAYAFHLAENQPFVDGNKRTALVAASVFLDLNGYDLAESDDLYDAMIAVAEKRLDKRGLAAVFKAKSAPLM
jgi:death-on-curing protein